jgi:hypothetical protein
LETLATWKYVALMGALFSATATWRVAPCWARWLCGQIGVATLAEGTALWYYYGLGLSTYWIYNLYLALNFCLLAVLLWEVGGRSSRARIESLTGLLFFGAMYVYDLTTGGFFDSFVSRALVVGGFALAVQSSLALYRMLDDPTPLPQRPLFWALLSLVLFYLCATPLFGLQNFLVARDSPILPVLGMVRDLVFIVHYGLFTYSLIAIRRKHAKAP